jgi:hypothetical protein
MSVILAVAMGLFGLLDLISIATEVFGRRTGGGHGLKESAAIHWRRVLLHLGVWVLIIGGFWAIVHFGPLRPVHEWIR